MRGAIRFSQDPLGWRIHRSRCVLYLLHSITFHLTFLFQQNFMNYSKVLLVVHHVLVVHRRRPCDWLMSRRCRRHKASCINAEVLVPLQLKPGQFPTLITPHIDKVVALSQQCPTAPLTTLISRTSIPRSESRLFILFHNAF